MALRWLLGLALLGCTTLANASGYFRAPTIGGDTIVFTAEGDLWRVGAAGGTAVRLTTHPAQETQAQISPDGREVAFVASYDGQQDVYVMALGGGEPRRMSWDGARVILSGWTPDGRIAYASDNTIGPSWRFLIRIVDPRGVRAAEELPLADANRIAFVDDSAVLFTRFGLQVTGDNARAYRGGARGELWRWTLGSDLEATRIAADWNATVSVPMAWNGAQYALADASGLANLYALGTDGVERRALTRHTEFEVRAPSLGGGRIVYQHGADIRVLDLVSGDDRALSIVLGSDFEQRRERFIRTPLAFITGITIAPDGRRAVVAARGRVVTAANGPERRIEVQAPPGARLREAHLSSESKTVFAIVDADGASEIWSFPADGSAGGRALTGDGKFHRWGLLPSPDGKKIAHEDKRGQLWLLDVDSGRNRVIDTSTYAGDGARDALAWSADSRWLAAARPDSARLRDQILVFDAKGSRKATVTSDRYESSSPAFSSDGRFLYFVSNRSFQPTPTAPWGDRNMGPMFDRRARIYALALQPGNRFPFAPPSELSPANDATNDESDSGNGRGDANERDRPAASEDADKPVKSKKPSRPLPPIIFEGLAERLYEVPLEPGNYADLALDDERLYFLDREASPDARPELKTLEISDDAPKATSLTQNLLDYALSADRMHLLLIRPPAAPGPNAPLIGDVQIIAAGERMPENPGKATVRLGDWTIALEPDREWRQMFDEAWRMHRAFSFDAEMRGLDWDAIRGKYAPLAARVTDRAELDDLLAQMIAELGILHSQIRPGELRPDPEAPTPAWLGARLEAAPGGVRIARIYRTDPELPSERAPLAQPGVDARDGDVITAVNGRAVTTPGQVLEAIRQQAGQQVLLDIARDRGATQRTIVVPVPTERDTQLRYSDWVESTRARVEAGGAGRIGYLHLRAMGASDVASFAREFYANFDREGLIIDVRRNRGGNIDSWVIANLLRRAWAFWQPPLGTPYWNMQQTFRGHVVVLADQLTYSDGETFAAGVRALGIGPVIGMQTAGAGIWLSDRNRLSDNGAARIAEFGQFAADGRWLIEGAGVAPDIVIDNPPVATARGGDAQLERALAEVKRRLDAEPMIQPPAERIPPVGTAGFEGGRSEVP